MASRSFRSCQFSEESYREFKPFLHRNQHANNGENNTPTARQKGALKKRGQILREEKPRERLLFDINRRQSEILTEFSRKALF